MVKKYFKYFIYLSLIFLIIALYKGNYLVVPKLYSITYILASVFVLFLGFIMEAVTWKKTLDIMGYGTSIKNAIISIGLSIFGKYIPGKVWLIAGRSAYISKTNNYPEKEILSVSVITQMLSLWMGVLFGLFGLLLLKNFMVYGTLAFLLWVFLTLVLFSKHPHRFFLSTFNKIFKKNVSLPFIDFQQILKVLPWYFIRWSFYTIAFFLLVSGLTPEEAPIFVGFGYPLAGTLGLVVFFIPGGLGIREGILVAYLRLGKFPLDLATTISLTSRLWFLAGEVFIFLMAILLSGISKFRR